MSTRLATHELDNRDELALIADGMTPLSVDLAERFRLACWLVAEANDGWVHPCDVTALLKAADPDVNVRRVSALWSTATAKDDGYLDVTDRPARIDGAVSRGNGNKSTVYRRWRGWQSAA